MVTLSEEKIMAEIDAEYASKIKVSSNIWKIDAQNIQFRGLNTILRTFDRYGAEKVEIQNVYGQRYIGTDLKSTMKIDIYGTPGNDLGAFMNGPNIVVHGNAQDCIANTMNEGQIVVNGRAGDITGYAMRGGKLFVKGDVGYRCGIHMKEYLDKKPLIVVGGIAQDFLGEYMAGGTMLVLGLNLKDTETYKARYIGTGMHGGVLYIRGEVTNVGKEVKVTPANKTDIKVIECIVKEYCAHFNEDQKQIMSKQFYKITPESHRPYGRVYA